MQLADYLIDHQQSDWSAILADWVWLLPKDEFTIWLMNRYGDLFLVLEDGTVHMLDVGNGSLEKLAESRDDFCRKLDEAPVGPVLQLHPSACTRRGIHGREYSDLEYLRALWRICIDPRSDERSARWVTGPAPSQSLTRGCSRRASKLVRYHQRPWRAADPRRYAAVHLESK
jgi:hypothetical protein